MLDGHCDVMAEIAVVVDRPPRPPRPDHEDHCCEAPAEAPACLLVRAPTFKAFRRVRASTTTTGSSASMPAPASMAAILVSVRCVISELLGLIPGGVAGSG